jgi:hypothetical protein
MGAWGKCEVDYSREQIVSPYPFAAAQAHYEALLEAARAEGGPTQYSRENMPPDWDGRYTRNVNIVFGLMLAGEEPIVPAEYHEPPQWIIGYHNQIPTDLSLLTPEYQQRLVQQLYHQAHDHAAQWSLMFCRPEGFMRWWSGPGGPGSLDVMVTPTRVPFLGGSGNAIRNVHVGRQFDASGVAPLPGAPGRLQRRAAQQPDPLQSDHLPCRRAGDAGGAGHGDSVQGRGPLRPAVGRYLGRVFRAGNAATRG